MGSEHVPSRQLLLWLAAALLLVMTSVSLQLGPHNLLMQNELGILEMIHCVVETLDKW